VRSSRPSGLSARDSIPVASACPRRRPGVRSGSEGDYRGRRCLYDTTSRLRAGSATNRRKLGSVTCAFRVPDSASKSSTELPAPAASVRPSSRYATRPHPARLHWSVRSGFPAAKSQTMTRLLLIAGGHALACGIERQGLDPQLVRPTRAKRTFQLTGRVRRAGRWTRSPCSLQAARYQDLRNGFATN